MFIKRAISVFVPLGFGGAVFSTSNQLKNESKRRFYEDDVEIVPVPGTVIEAPATEIESLGSNRIIDGISVRSDPTLESYFKSIRGFAYNTVKQVQAYVDQGYTKYNNTEREVTQTVSELHNKSEDLLPNSLYIIIATLSGNIAARQRGIISKIVFPLTLGTLSFKYFLPETFSNTANFAWKLEQQKIPHIAETQQIAVTKAGELVQSLEESGAAGKKGLENGVQSLRKSVADITGLNIDEEVSKK